MAFAEKHPLLDGVPLSLTPVSGEAPAVNDGADQPVLLLLGDSPAARAVARLAAECGFVVDMADWTAEGDAPGAETALEAPGAADASGTPAEADLPGVRRRLLLGPGESPMERCDIGHRHYVCIFPPDEATATRALEDVLASHAFYVGLWATRAGRERVWAALREAGVPDAELAAVRCPMGLGDLAVNARGPVPAAVVILAELLAAQAGSRRPFRLED